MEVSRRGVQKKLSKPDYFTGKERAPKFEQSLQGATGKPTGLRKPFKKIEMAKLESSGRELTCWASCPEVTSNKRLEKKEATELNEIYTENLPSEITEGQFMQKLDAFKPMKVHKVDVGLKCYAFVNVGDPENVPLAVNHLNNTAFKGCRLVVRGPDQSRSCERPVESLELELPPLEKVDKYLSRGTKTLLPSRKASGRRQTYYAVPLEMRSMMLVEMLSGCFKVTDWIVEIAKIQGEVGLMVMESFPQMPFFWAMNLTPDVYVKMCKLFNVLSKVTDRQPFLRRKDVQRGLRCMAEYPGVSGEWNRCWTVDVVDHKVILFYVDSGSTACVPAETVKALDDDQFWAIAPLVQPFFLQQGVLGNQKMDGAILKGNVVGFHEAEPHILKFSKSDDS
ncbi:tudor domain-containing protein 10-like isoform X2 [Narcine bancroftii]|uniref:tudor domain-containing protein 10-like isoform X2 n=1 Tax=Narcine bancroftii TaxID=1343680 RepID=UPI003832063C